MQPDETPAPLDSGDRIAFHGQREPCGVTCRPEQVEVNRPRYIRFVGPDRRTLQLCFGVRVDGNLVQAGGGQAVSSELRHSRVAANLRLPSEDGKLGRLFGARRRRLFGSVAPERTPVRLRPMVHGPALWVDGKPEPWSHPGLETWAVVDSFGGDPGSFASFRRGRAVLCRLSDASRSVRARSNACPASAGQRLHRPRGRTPRKCGVGQTSVPGPNCACRIRARSPAAKR